MDARSETSNGTCQVVFKVPELSEDRRVYLMGNLNGDGRVIRLVRADDGTFQVTLDLTLDREYRLQLVVE